MKADDKRILYSHYITTHFGKIHSDLKDYAIHKKYFKKNYLRHLPLDKNKKILDVGCGMGHFLSFLDSEEYKNNLGIDISEENIEFCKKNKFNVELSDIFYWLKNTTDTYDVIIMNDIVEHLEKPEIFNLLTLIMERLASGGRLIVKAPNASNPIMASSSRYVDFTHELLFTEESLSQVLKISGFKQIKIYPQNLYVFEYNPINYLARIFNFVLNGIFRLLFCFYGRKTTKIFTKNLIAVADKD
jgi:2-polyprenyl-3-methyl-5-hydroxy-6-metoxy-1,4-benzoquinol methylase